jgi:nickel transport protein
MFATLMLALFLSASASAASAHKVIMSVYKSGDLIEGELGFSSGEMAADQVIAVLDDRGNRLGETTTDADGFFTYKPAHAVTHVFRAELGAGHIGEAVMAAADLPAVAGAGAAPADASPVVEAAPASESAGIAAPLDEAAVAKMLRDELRPLRREIAAYKEKNDLQTILGGIGYILGLFGLAMYVAARRKLKDGIA